MARSMAASGSSRRRAWAARRLRTKLISRALRTCCVSQSSASSTVSIPSQVSGMPLALGPVGAQVAVEEQVHLRGDPALHVDAVGDVADRHVLLGRVGEERLPHPPRDRAVQGADAVGVPRELQGQHGHAERLVGVARDRPVPVP